MTMVRIASAVVQKPGIEKDDWDRVLKVSSNHGSRTASSVDFNQYSPDQYLLTHCTIVASVDVDEAVNVKTGSKVRNAEGEEINRPFNDYLIKPECSNLINANSDAWERKLLLATYKTFIGAENFVEHVQIPELSKGKVIDAVARDLGETVYIDILVATNRKHKDLIARIESGQLDTLSMGCTITFSQCTRCGNIAKDDAELCSHIKNQKGQKFVDADGNVRVVAELCFTGDTRVVLADGRRAPISSIKKGDEVLTHTGEVRTVVETHSRPYQGRLVELDVLGYPEKLQSTPNHPYWVLRPNQVCGCGCGASLPSVSKGSKHEYTRTYLPGHNPNTHVTVSEHPSFEFVEAGDLKEGDIVALPIPKGEKKPADLNESRAELLGWFLAEGSYIKRNGEYVGVSFTLNSYDEAEVAERLVALLKSEFEPEPMHRGTQGPVLSLLEESSGGLSKKEISNRLGLKKSTISNTLKSLKSAGLITSRKARSLDRQEHGVATLNEHIYTVALSGLDLEEAKSSLYGLPRVHDYARRSESGRKLVVCYTNRKAASWFKKNAGEYSHLKRLPSGAIFWPKSLQRILLKAYVEGDGHVDAQHRHKVSSTSIDLIDQMQLISARCGLWTRRVVVFDGKTQGYTSVTAPERESDNFLPRHSMYFQPSAETDAFFSMVETGKDWYRSASRRQQDGYFLYKIRGIDRPSFDGQVYNLGVGGINSYLVEGLAVHNCGHHTDPESVVFIEASWVANPAFKGAVMRNILGVGEEVEIKEPTKYEISDLQSRIESAHRATQSSWTDMFVRTASAAKEAQESFSEGLRLAFDFAPMDDEEGEGAPPPEDEAPLDMLVNDVKDKVLDRAVRELRDEVRDEPEREDMPAAERHLNDNIHHSSLKSLYASFVDRYAREIQDEDLRLRVFALLYMMPNPQRYAALKYRCSNLDIAAALYLCDRDDPQRDACSLDVYKSLAKVGSRNRYSSDRRYLRQLKNALGRVPTLSEALRAFEYSSYLN